MFLTVVFLLLFQNVSLFDHMPNYDSDLHKEFDFIIVGGGLSGCVLAAPLTAISHFNVLVLEAGDKPPLTSLSPMLMFVHAGTKYDWNYSSTPQRNANGRIIQFIRGKALGGSGSFNAVNWFRGNKRDYDLWESSGAEGWGWNDVLPYFKKLETDFSTDANISYSGFDGPIRVTNPWKGVTLYSAFFDEMKKLGYSYNDPHDGITTGFSVERLNVYKSVRQSTYTNYLIPVLERPNLKVVTNAVVEKILFNNRKEAIGVLYTRNGKKVAVYAHREVIVSAGAINTPQVLMLSGIGPKKHLESFGIEVIADLPVGNNFQDQFSLYGNFTKQAANVSNSKTLKQFLNNEGPLTNFSAVNAFVNTDLTRNYNYPDIQFLLSGQYLNPMEEELVYVLVWFILHPKSRGTIRLQSRNINVHPLIDPNFLGTEYDMQIGLRLAQSLVKLGNAIAGKQNEYSFAAVNKVNCEHLSERSDMFWRCIVKNNIQAALHNCCSAKMGSSSDPSSVVDTELRVIGVRNLRVIDASIMPTVPSANTQSSVIMVAEKGADLVKRANSRYN